MAGDPKNKNRSEPTRQTSNKEPQALGAVHHQDLTRPHLVAKEANGPHHLLAAQISELLVTGSHPDWLTLGRAIRIMNDSDEV